VIVAEQRLTVTDKVYPTSAGSRGVTTNPGIPAPRGVGASVSSDRTVKVWDAQTGQQLLTLTLKGELGYDWKVRISFSRDGKRLACNGPDGTATICDATPLLEKP
jgi:WD40 repeat protein